MAQSIPERRGIRPAATPVIRLLNLPLLLLRRQYRKLWVRVAFFAILSVALAVVGAFLRPVLPSGLIGIIDSSDVVQVLTIVATSMLAVSTFSLNVMVTVHRSAAWNATPRVHRLFLEDLTTQKVLATFIGAFVYALTTIILFQFDLYPPETAIIVMSVTVLVVLGVIVALLRWVDHLSTLGSLDDSLKKLETRAKQALSARIRQPALGATPLTDDVVIPQQVQEIAAESSGYVQLVDVAGLQDALPDGVRAYVLAAPGCRVMRGDTLVQIGGTVPDRKKREIIRCFVLGNVRTFEHDAEIGLLTLSEIASRALSPGVNDPGTAIEAMTRIQILLWEYAQRTEMPEPPVAPDVFLRPIVIRDLLQAGFAAAARDGAGQIEVASALRENLLKLASAPDAEMRDAAQDLAAHALEYADQSLSNDRDRERLHAIR